MPNVISDQLLVSPYGRYKVAPRPEVLTCEVGGKQLRNPGALGKEVLLIERFDRQLHETGWHRRAMVSALTMLELDEMIAYYAVLCP